MTGRRLNGMLAGLALVLLAAAPPGPSLAIGEVTPFAPGVASTAYSEVRLTLSPDGHTALWFSRDRPGGPGGYDIWMSRREAAGAWGPAEPVAFNSPGRDFDPAFSPDGRSVYFCSDRPGGLGGDDIYRVEVTASGFGRPEPLGANVNSPAAEFAPMLSPDRSRLLFSSNRPGGAGRQDLYTARRNGQAFEPARPLPGEVNTAADEFDATFLADGAAIVFARAPNLKTDRVDLVFASPSAGGYDHGVSLPLSVNSPDGDSYGPMLDWSHLGRLTVSARCPGAESMDIYLVDYRIDRREIPAP